MPEDHPTVYIVDDDEAVRFSLKLLAESVGYKAAAFGSAGAFLDTYDPEQPGCLVLDVRMRGMSGLDLQDELNRRGIILPVIVVSGHGDIPMAVRAMRNGALDFIEKPFRDQTLLDRIQQAIEIDEHRRAAHREQTKIQRRLTRLTPRESEVLELVVAGKTNKEIANQFGVSVRAVESHRARVMERMGADGLADLVRKVLTVRRNHNSGDAA